MITQADAKIEIIKLWNNYKTNWNNSLEYKQMKDMFTAKLQYEKPYLFNFKCQGGDKLGCYQMEVIECWIDIFEKNGN